METYEQKIRRVLTNEATERLIIAIQIYNNTIYSGENSSHSISGDIWFGLVGMLVAFPSRATYFFGFMFLFGIIRCLVRCWRISYAQDVSILENPEEAATYRFSRRHKLQPIPTFPLLRNSEGESKLMESLYDDIVTEEMRSDRDLVVTKLMEAGLRHLVTEVITTSPTYIDFSEDGVREEEPEEDSFWESDREE